MCTLLITAAMILATSTLLPVASGKHVLLIGDSVDRHMVTELCLAFKGDLRPWGMDWHRYRYIPWISDGRGG